MKVLAYFRPDKTDRNWFNLLVHYAVNNAYGGYYKIIAVENIGGLSDILLGGNSVTCVQTKDELVAMAARLEARGKRNSTIIEDGKGNSVIPYEEDDPFVYMYGE
tara:strand:- start:326 stop:640 length:315 start_codon:yes stop_codon:yes gene_type:complete